MPLRRFFAQRGAKHPVAYSNAVLAAGVLMCMIIAVTISVQATNRALRAEQARERATNERSRAAMCVVVERMIDVYTEPTPPTKTGRQARNAWVDMGHVFQCSER